MNFSKMFKMVVALLFTVVVAVNSFPGQDYRYYHPGTVMLGGYYGIPPMGYPNYLPEESDPIPAASEDFEREAVTEDVLVEADEEREFKEQTTQSPQAFNGYPKPKEAQVPKKPTVTKPKRKNVPADEDSLPSSNFPFGSGKPNFFNTFFPIMVGGSSRGWGKPRQGDDMEGPGGATAIANSFSTGRGGVASSHATSFGDVFFSSGPNDMLLKKNKRM